MWTFGRNYIRLFNHCLHVISLDLVLKIGSDRLRRICVADVNTSRGDGRSPYDH